MTIQRDKWSDYMILRIMFLGMLCIPILYLFFVLMGYLVDDIVMNDEKIPKNAYSDSKPSYARGYYDRHYEEPEEEEYRKDRVNKNKRKFRVIR